MKLTGKRLSPVDRHYRDLTEHFQNCLRCRANGGMDAGKKSLCPSGQALYGLWERQLDRAEKFSRGEL